MNDSVAVQSYHVRTKHRLERYAAGPETLDWDAQPAAFRDWQDTQQTALPRDVLVSKIAWRDLLDVRSAAPLNIANLGSLLRLCAGLTAWKEYAGSRWSLRAHPSSGNLHPTETWLIAAGVADLADGLYHYHALHHALEKRAWSDDIRTKGVWLGFSSIHWREAWKYGERAFRYCQLDIGHVLAAVCCAAALHGWRARLLTLDSTALASCLGLDREADYAGVEGEEPEVMLALDGADDTPPSDWQHWAGRASLLDPRHFYKWPVIDEVAAATRGALPRSSTPLPAGDIEKGDGDISAAQVILKRRSAQAFDGVSVMPNDVFRQVLRALLPGGSPVWEMWSYPARVHPVLMVHRVADVEPGLYALPRLDAAQPALKAAFRDTFLWQPVDARLPLFKLVAASAGKIARTLSCHQDIASKGSVTFAMVAEFAAPLAADPAAYRHLHWEAGMLGHVITLALEAAGWRGTGIGCFFDDSVHEMLGLSDNRFQVIYHYAAGMPLDDPRISTLPAYL